MSALEGTPVNKNFLSPLNFRFQIKRAPNVNFFIQKVNIPNIALPETYHNNPFVKIPYAGDHMQYGTLDIAFKVDEDFVNYLEIHNWIRGLGFPRGFEEYKAISDGNTLLGNGLRSDISLIVLNSSKNPNYEIVFVDAFPIELSELQFLSTDTSVDYLQATVSFKYTLFNIERIT
jgi:hypothetical protein